MIKKEKDKNKYTIFGIFHITMHQNVAICTLSYNQKITLYILSYSSNPIAAIVCNVDKEFYRITLGTNMILSKKKWNRLHILLKPILSQTN